MTLTRLASSDASHFAKIKKRRAEEEERRRAAVSAERIVLNDIAFQRGRLLGVGTFGRVYEALDLNTGAIIAVKQIELKSKKAEETALAVKQEIKLMEGLNHPNIVRLLGFSVDGSTLNVMMEFVAGNSLDSIVQSSGPLHEAVIRKYIKQMLMALEYCHSKNVLHRDIKGKNVLLSNTGLIKMADFGSAKLVEDVATKDDPSVGYAYTPLWCAPEVMTGKYNYKVDIWSIGCCVIELAAGKEPWSERNFESSFAALYYIASKPKEMPAVPDTLSPAGHDFIRLCLTRDVDARPTASQLLQHPFITEQLEAIAPRTATVNASMLAVAAKQSSIEDTVRMSDSNAETVPMIAGTSSTVDVGHSFVATDSAASDEIHSNLRFKQALTFP